MKKILIVEDTELNIDLLMQLLEDDFELLVARDGEKGVEMAVESSPDLILMDIRMPNCDGLKATRLIKTDLPEIKIVILTTSSEDQDLFETVKSGACGYLLKSMDADELVEALRQAQAGILPFSPGLGQKLLDEFAQRSQPDVAKEEAKLTDRQLQVLKLVAEGLSYKEVGIQLGLSPRTIKYHMAEIMQVLHLDHRAQVLTYAGQIGLGAAGKH